MPQLPVSHLRAYVNAHKLAQPTTQSLQTNVTPKRRDDHDHVDDALKLGRLTFRLEIPFLYFCYIASRLNEIE